MKPSTGGRVAIFICTMVWLVGCKGSENVPKGVDAGQMIHDSELNSDLNEDTGGDSASDTETRTTTPPDTSSADDGDTGTGSVFDTATHTVAATDIGGDSASDTETRTTTPPDTTSDDDGDTGTGSDSDTVTDTVTVADTCSDSTSDTETPTTPPADTDPGEDSDVHADSDSETETPGAASSDTESLQDIDGGDDTATHADTGDDTNTLSYIDGGNDTASDTDDPHDGGTEYPSDGPDLDNAPNVLMIVVDDLGYADFAPFGNHDPRISTPNISRLADSGTVFSQAYTTGPVCSPSRAGLNTGKNQFRWDEDASWTPGLPESVRTIAEYLKEFGYGTSRIGKNDFGTYFHRNDGRVYPLNHGYDEFLGFNAHAHDYWLLSAEIRDRTPDPYGTSAVLGPLMHNMGEKSYEEGYLTDIFTDEAIRIIRGPNDKPFFLTLSYNSVHHLIHEVPMEYLDRYEVEPIPNYDPDDMVEFGTRVPGSYLAYYDKYSRMGAIEDEPMRRYYLANLNCLDDNIGRVLDALDEEGLDENTLIIFISDNGGSPLTGANNAPLTAGKYSLWEGGIRVPMVMSWPGRIDAGQVQTQYVSATDILPTIAEAVGIEITDETIDGIDLFSPDPERLLVWQWQDTWAVRKGDWKLTNTDEDHWKGRPSALYIQPIADDLSIKLFNLADDPGERVDLADLYPEKVAELQIAYQNWCDNNIGRY